MQVQNSGTALLCGAIHQKNAVHYKRKIWFSRTEFLHRKGVAIHKEPCAAFPAQGFSVWLPARKYNNMNMEEKIMFDVTNLKNDITAIKSKLETLKADYNNTRFNATAAALKSKEDEIKQQARESSLANAKLFALETYNAAEAEGLTGEALNLAVKEKIISKRTYAYDSARINDQNGASLETTYGKFNLIETWEWLGFETFKGELNILGLRLTLAAADLTKAQHREIIRSCYKLNALAKEKIKAEETGEVPNPLSKSQTVNAMQEVVDKVLFRPCDTDEKKNLYRVLNCHWNTLLLSVTAGDKKAVSGGLKMLNARSLEMFIADTLNAIVTKRAATISYKVDKNAVVPATTEETPAPTEQTDAAPLGSEENAVEETVKSTAKKPATKKAAAKKA